MVVTQNQIGMGGRLGNTMFGIASTIGIAVANGMAYTFPEWKYQHGFEKKLPNFRVEPEVKIIEEQYNYEKITLNNHSITNLVGYFQSEKYWSHCKNEVLYYFEFKEEIKRQLKYIWNDVLAQRPIAIHVRRGDYLTLPEFHPVLPLDYYNKAISQFDHNQKFIVFSDDIEWCKKHFLTDKFYFANGSEIEDMCLMSMCNGHIIANSSFSWWGHYLSGSQTCIAPKQLFGEALKNHDTKDWYLPHFKII